MKKILIYISLLFLLFLNVNACLIPNYNIDITESVTICSGTYTLNNNSYDTLFNILDNNINIYCNDTIINGWIGDGEDGIYGFRSSNTENISINNCNFNNMRTIFSANNIKDLFFMNIESNNISVDILSLSNFNNIFIKNIYADYSGNLWLENGKNVYYDNLNNIGILYNGWYELDEGEGINYNISINNTLADRLSIHGSNFTIYNSQFNYMDILTDSVNIQNSYIYGNTINIVNDYTNYDTEKIIWCYNNIGNDINTYNGDNIYFGTCEVKSETYGLSLSAIILLRLFPLLMLISGIIILLIGGKYGYFDLSKIYTLDFMIKLITLIVIVIILSKLILV
jgi:hypothetical protein